MLLRTHSVMAFILALTAAGMFVHLYRLKQSLNAKGWLMAFYLSLFFWQIENVVRYSMPPGFEGSLPYKLSVIVVLIPSLALTLISHTQYVYRFLANVYQKESRLVLNISAGLFLVEFGFVVWNEFFHHSDFGTMIFSAFVFSSFFTLWMISLALRKAFYLRNTDKRLSDAHFVYAGINGCYVIGSTISVAVGFLTVLGTWSYFMFVWLGNLAAIVLYIGTSAVPASFQTKVTGFTYVVAASILCIITMSIYPPEYTASMEKQLAQQQGLLRLLVIIPIVVLLIVILMPLMLNVSLTRPLQRLLEGVQAVNEGKLDTQVEVGLPDEIGMLTRNFNQMTKSLIKARVELTAYAHTLEQKVTMRTEQLQRSLNELRSTQAQLIQTEKMASLGELTAGIAHEIKNPLNFIINFCEISADLTKELKEEIGKEESDEETVRALLADIEGNFEKITHHGKKASAIVSSMLEHSRTSPGKREETNLNELIELYLNASYEEMLLKNKNFQVIVEKHFDPAVGKLAIIPQDIGKVMMNLFNNAFYTVNEKKKEIQGSFEPTVSVTTRKIGEKVYVSVSDNGLGMTPAVKEKIFQPFFTTKPAGEGTGLGLSLSYDIITKGHGGQINVETEEGEGTSILLILPMQHQTSKQEQASF